MKSFLELTTQRQSDRSFSSQPIEQEVLMRVLEAGRMAPSACNAQPWKLIVVTDPEKRMNIADACTSKVLGMNHFSKQAPVMIVLVEERANLSSRFGGMVKQIHYPHIDMGILAAHLCLAAADEGLGSCMLGWLNEKKIQNILQIPSDRKVLLVLLLGYSQQPTRKKNRKELPSIVRWEKYT